MENDGRRKFLGVCLAGASAAAAAAAVYPVFRYLAPRSDLLGAKKLEFNVSDLPEGEKVPPHVPSDVMDAKTARVVYGDGSFGGKYQVPDEVMGEVFEAVLADILQLLRFEQE